MSTDDNSDQNQRANAFITEFAREMKTLLESPEYKTVRDRAVAVGSLFASPGAPGSTPTKLTLRKFSNYLVSSAIHGTFIGLWSEFDLILEVLIMRISGLSATNTSIVFTPIQAGIKMQILTSLLNEHSNDADGTKLLRDIQDIASRNAYVHGFWEVDETVGSIFLYHRDAKSTYTVKKRGKNWNDAANHLLDFTQAMQKINTHFKITQEEVANYKKSIVAQEPIHASRAEHRRQSTTSARKAKKIQPLPPPEPSRE